MRTRAVVRRQQGQSLIEFALVLPLLALMMIGAATLGRYAYDTQIVHESMVETAKMAVNDRVDPQTDTAYQLSNTELLRYLRDMAHEADHSIDGRDITLPNGFGNCNNGNECRAWQFNPSADVNDHGAVGDFFSNLDIGLSIHKGACSNNSTNLITFLNPGLETMRVDFQFNTGLGGDWRISPRTFEYNFSRYQMLSFPLNFPEGGCIKDDGWAP